ncbi:MAG: hypothetical protein H3C31_05570 [Brumimicrobium sp.]|nr:hypothetical protein [Brumimicrobium sp.]
MLINEKSCSSIDEQLFLFLITIYTTSVSSKEEDESLRNARILISQTTGSVIKTAMRLLGIKVTNRM